MFVKKIPLKKTLQYGLAAILLSTLAIVSSSTEAARTTVSLNVKDVSQAAGNWCWAATSVSILDYFNESVTQHDFVEYVKGEAVNKPENMRNTKDGIEHFGVSSTRESDSMSWSRTVREINTDSPILVAIKWKTQKIGHNVVIDGYINDSTRYVMYMDPWDGQHFTMPYDAFLNSSRQEWLDSLYGFETN
ncbi:hypothetical protein B5G50_02165 [Brevibacillus brevis]|nr:hypothetical protein B5G50_02165 [Brevibacillus brevis]